MRARRYLVLLLFAGTAFAQTDRKALQKVFSDYYEDLLRWHPEIATSLGRREYNRAWSDYSPAARQRQTAALRAYRDRLRQFDRAALPEQDRISLELLQYKVEEELTTEPIAPLLLVGQLFGFHNRVLQTFDEMPSDNVHDYEDMIARINAIPEYVERAIAGVDEGIPRGVIQPKVVAGLVIAQLARQGGMSEDTTPLLTAFRRFPNAVPASERDRLIREARVAYATRFLPAWQRLHRWAVQQYLPKARGETAMSAIPDGANWYRKLVRHSTTTAMTPQEIHELGRRELERIEREMTAIAPWAIRVLCSISRRKSWPIPPRPSGPKRRC